MFINNLSKKILNAGGKLIPLVFFPEGSHGTGLMNASIFNDNGRLLVNVRHTNYTLWHCENKQLYNSCYGPLVYFNPENDCRLVTKNHICTLKDDLTVNEVFPVKTERCDSPNPLWEFHGLEDARLFRWDNRLFLSGVRRDTTPNGEGRMELSEIILTDFDCTEIIRQRIPMPDGKKSYCEKNWVPILDQPYHYVKWTNPTEIVHYDPLTKLTSVAAFNDKKIEGWKDFRGGSQVIPYKGYYLAIMHVVNLLNNVQGQKDATYRHHFVVWDKAWNIVSVSDEFALMDGAIEFACGLCIYKGDLLISFGFQDNAAFILQIPEKIIDETIGLTEDKIKIKPHIYQGSQFGEDWFTYPKLYSDIVNKFSSGSKFVEVGCWKGKSAAYMATEIMNSGKNLHLFCVDKWEEHWELFLNNTESFQKVLSPIRLSSTEAPELFEDNSLDFVFIDASHEYEDVKADILAWYPKVKIGGILAGHDYHEDKTYNEGVYQAVNETVGKFTVSEMCWIHEVVETKLDGLPSVYCLSLEESNDRRENLIEHFNQYHKLIHFKQFKRYVEGDAIITGNNLDKINLHAKGSNISNLLTIKAWYEETDEKYGFICEDDLSLETVPYWGFTWKQFMARLPLDWECVQLIQVRESWSNHKLKVREYHDFCNAVYILKREYAKKLIDKYIKDGVFNLECALVPTVENILFSLGKVYSIPLFVEDIPHTKTTFPVEGYPYTKAHWDSYQSILNFWKDNGGKFTVNDFTPMFESWRTVKSPILEITTNIHSKGCAINCVFCPQTVLINEYKGTRVLSLENFKLVIDKLPTGIGVIFAGLSEPWLNPDCTEMVLYAHSKGHQISIFTTGIGMTIEDVDRIKHIPFASGVDRGFTLHIPDVEKYANHPLTDKYIPLLEHIRDSNIAHLRVVSMGMTPDDIRDIFPYVQKARMFSRAGNLAKEEVFKPRLARLKTEYLSTDNGEGKVSCAAPEGLHHTVMMPNGDVSICCQDYELKHVIGNLFTQEYNDIIPGKDTPFALCRYCENGKKLD
jgi:SAM-dependent methyltransferase